MIKNGKEYRIVSLGNDPEWPCECDSPHCINYCEDCISKMFTKDEIKILKDEARERYRMELEEWHRERVRKGYGLCM